MARGQMDTLRWLFLGIVFIALMALAISGCGNSVESEGTSFGQDIQVVTVDGHEYVVYDGYKAGGITHKANCDAEY